MANKYASYFTNCYTNEEITMESKVVALLSRSHRMNKMQICRISKEYMMKEGVWDLFEIFGKHNMKALIYIIIFLLFSTIILSLREVK